MTFTCTYEEGVARLNEIAQLLSTGSASLDESLALFTEASELIGYCENKLADAKLKVEQVAVRFDED